MADSSRNELKWDLLIADCWDDEALKKRLMKDPAAVCKERGIEVPAGMKLCVLADSDSVLNVVIPPPPNESELSAEQLESVAGGGTNLCVQLCVGQACASLCVNTGQFRGGHHFGGHRPFGGHGFACNAGCNASCSACNTGCSACNTGCSACNTGCRSACRP